jgi:hypothetical protein
VYEDRIHLFFHCNFSAKIWTYLQIEWQRHDDLQVVLSEAKRSFRQPFFMEVIITAPLEYLAYQEWEKIDRRMYRLLDGRPNLYKICIGCSI